MRHKHQQAAGRGPPVALAAAAVSANQVAQLDAVIIRNLIYEVGRGSQRKRILNRINLTVPEGSIYGLLGPSGCGKTTMLKCIVGRVWPKSGSVMVFGLQPGGGEGEVPGRHVGYMPQEISIYEDFTIEETLNYFGMINRMARGAIARRVDFLLQFLDLPTKKRLVANLSGGQKRRVSLAAALVHSPPLLILDEPTVGVDPVLRQSIWRHLVAMTKSERISVIITTHYIEEARLANVVGLMRNGRILAEDSPGQLMRANGLASLEDVFLKLCMSDSTQRQRRRQADAAQAGAHTGGPSRAGEPHADSLRRRPAAATARAEHKTSVAIGGRGGGAATAADADASAALEGLRVATVRINTGTNEIHVSEGPARLGSSAGAGSQAQPVYVNEAVEEFSSDGEDEDERAHPPAHAPPMLPLPPPRAPAGVTGASPEAQSVSLGCDCERPALGHYLAAQQLHWAARRASAQSLLAIQGRAARAHGAHLGLEGRAKGVLGASGSSSSSSSADFELESQGDFCQWCKTLLAVTWKNYTRLRRNPPVLAFQFVLPAIQVILFCLCIGGEPFDVPVAVVNDELVPDASAAFLGGLSKRVVRQIKYDNLTSAIEAVRRGHVWGAVHIPDKFTEHLQSRLIMGEEVTNETIANGTIRIYPDLTNLHLAMTLEDTFRSAFVSFARNKLQDLGYDKSLADLPIQTGAPIYGSANKEGYLEFMAPGVVVSICYVMATGLTALAFILERRDGLLERSLVSGVQTSQILLAHAITQIFVMSFQILLVLGCTFFIFEVPSRGPFVWVVLLILLQGSTGTAFGLLVSAICAEEETAVMMVVGTFYTNLILAGIIWPIEAMPHWVRPLSYMQPQTLPTDSLRNILSRGWGITEPGVFLGFIVTIGWLAAFLLAAGVIFKYSRG